jgi:ubiquinone/menaquinone biosynthesis C-methylase UbiE
MPIECKPLPRLKLLPKHGYAAVNRADPLRFYYWPVLGGLYRRRVELCLAECAGGRRVLEVGFGSGLTFLNLHGLYEEIHGLDLTAPAQEVTEKFAALGVATHLRQGDARRLPYEDGTFDTVLMVSILEHLKPGDQAAVAREVRRVLRPGGQFVYGVPVERPLMVFLFRLLACDIRKHHFSTPEDVRRGAASCLTLRRRVVMNGRPSFLGPVYEVSHFVKG